MDKNWPVTYLWSLSMVLADSPSFFLMSELNLEACVAAIMAIILFILKR